VSHIVFLLGQRVGGLSLVPDNQVVLAEILHIIKECPFYDV